jgi:hypothetical protein
MGALQFAVGGIRLETWRLYTTVAALALVKRFARVEGGVLCGRLVVLVATAVTTGEAT